MTQADVMLEMLRRARLLGETVSVTRFVDAGMYRYGAVKFKLEERGHRIMCMPKEKGSSTHNYWLERDADCTCREAPLFCTVHKGDL